MPDYQKGKIYKLWSPQGEEDEIYIGSTCDKLYKRKNAHKQKTSLCKSKILFEKYDDVRIEVIEEYPCNSKAELLKKEGDYIKNNKCLNRNIPDRTKQEWFQDNKQKILERNEEYQKEYQKEYRKKNYEKNKKYYQDNKEKILEKQKKNKEYYENLMIKENEEYLEQKNKSIFRNLLN